MACTGPCKPAIDNKDYMRAGRLLELLAAVPEDTPVYYQRIDDFYFEHGSGWPEHSVMVEDDDFPNNPGQYVQAWGAWYDKEHKCVFITAHY